MTATTTSKPMTKKAQAEALRQEAVAQLRGELIPGTVVKTILRHTSRSGMMRHIGVYAGEREITHLIARVLDDKIIDSHGGTAIKVPGCGMDMGFHLVYSLSRTLYPHGHNCTGTESCPSNDHSNDYGQASRDFYEQLRARTGEDRLYDDSEQAKAQHTQMRLYIAHRLDTDLGYHADRTHSDGGYALRQRWL